MGANCERICSAREEQQQYREQKEEEHDEENQILQSLKTIPIDKIKKLCIEVNQFPINSPHIQSKIQKLSTYFKGISSNIQSPNESSKGSRHKIFRYRPPYNFFFINLQQEERNQKAELPKGKCIIYKLKQNGQFGGYFEGILKDNLEPNMQGCLIIFPNGSYFQGKSESKGTYMNENTGLRYEGQWRNQMPYKQGKQKNNRGIYEGQYNKGQKFGKGRFVWNDSSFYEGQFEKGIFHGIGILKDEIQKYQYQGEFFNGEKHGKAIETTNNQKYTGEFKLGLRSGYGKVEIYENQQAGLLSKVYEGDFYSNQPHGKGILVLYANGKQKEKIKGLWTQGNLTSIFSHQLF